MARTLSDLTSQNTSVNDAQLTNIFNASTQIMTPYTTTPLQSTISELYVDPNTLIARVQWSQGVMIDLGPFDGNQGFAMATNAEDQKVGFLSGAQSGPAIWKQRKAMLLPTLGGPGGDADDINDAGLGVGSSGTSTGEIHAALWVGK